MAAASTDLLAQGTSPWLQAIDVLQQAFTGPIARGLSLIAIVVGGLMFAFGEGGSKKALAGIVFGLGIDLPPGTSPLSKLDLGPFEVHSMV